MLGIGFVVGINVATATRTRFIKVFGLDLARYRPGLATERLLRFRRSRAAAFKAPGLDSHGRIPAALEYEEHLFHDSLEASDFAGILGKGILVTGILERAGAGERTCRRTRVDFNLVAIRSACGLHHETGGCSTKVNATHADPGFLRGKREQQVFGNLARSPVGTAANALLLGTRECRVPIVRVKVLDLFRALHFMFIVFVVCFCQSEGC